MGLTKLKSVEMGANGLTGTLPSWIFDLSSLGEKTKKPRCCLRSICLSTDNYGVEILSLLNNFFTGSIPSEMGRLTNLTRLDLEGNNLWGTIPTEIGLLTKLGE